MAGMVEAAIERGIEALKTRDVDLAHQIIADDIKINRKRYETEEKCLELIAMQQPLAGDLRTVVSVLHITVDLERMGDHAEGIAKIAIMLADEPPLKPYIDIPRMAEIAIDMLMGSLEAFKHRDPDRARAICDQDDEVDALYEQVYRELLTFMINDPQDDRARDSPDLGRAQPGAHRRPRDEHLRARRLPGRRQDRRAKRLEVLSLSLEERRHLDRRQARAQLPQPPEQRRDQIIIVQPH